MHKQHKTELVATPAPESLVFVSSHDKRVQLYLIGKPNRGSAGRHRPEQNTMSESD